MLRIRTKLKEDKVYTLMFMGKWITITSLSGGTHPSSSSVYGKNLMEAGINHLASCQMVKEYHERRDVTGRLLHGDGHQDEPSGVSDGHDGSDREGINGDGGKEWEEVLPPHPFDEADEGPF